MSLFSRRDKETLTESDHQAGDGRAGNRNQVFYRGMDHPNSSEPNEKGTRVGSTACVRLAQRMRLSSRTFVRSTTQRRRLLG